MPVRLGVIGLGNFGINHLRCYTHLQRRGIAELVGACDISEKRLRERQGEFAFRPYTDYRDMLAAETLDAVSVVTSDHLHRHVTLDALGAGCHVLVEKPMDVTVAGCEEMVAAAQHTRRLLHVDFHKRYDPFHLELRDLVADGALGRLQYGYVHAENRIDIPSVFFRTTAHLSSSAWYVGIHFFDLMRFIMQADGVRVFATGFKDKLEGMGIDTWDSIQATVEFANGAWVRFDTCWIIPEGFPARIDQGLRLVGTEGMMEIDSQDRGSRSVLSRDGKTVTYNPTFLKRRTDASGSPYWRGYGTESIEDFVHHVAMVKAGRDPETLTGVHATGRDGLAATRIAESAHRSVETGEIVTL